LLPLLTTFIDILVLRRGPEIVPASWLVLAFALVLMLLSTYAVETVVPLTAERNYLLTWSVYGLGLAFYGVIISMAGYTARLLPAMSSIIACGALITFLFAASFLVIDPLLGRQTAAVVATLVIFWSIPVEGHIMARAIGQHWLVGIVIAVIAFAMQYGLHQMARGQS